MNLKSLSLLILAGLFLLSTAAFADPRIDLFPKSVKFSVSKREFTNEKYLNIYIDVVAAGNVAFNNTGSMKVLFKNRFFSGRVYAPASRGGIAGGPIQPGETGLLAFEVPFAYISHCEKVAVHIDLNRNMQFGPGVFSNDEGTFQARDVNNRLLCLSGPIVVNTNVIR